MKWPVLHVFSWEVELSVVTSNKAREEADEKPGIFFETQNDEN